jgi:hypothetical protein
LKTFPKEGPEAFAPLLPSILKAVMDKEVGFPTNNLHGIEIRNSYFFLWVLPLSQVCLV